MIELSDKKQKQIDLTTMLIMTDILFAANQ